MTALDHFGGQPVDLDDIGPAWFHLTVADFIAALGATMTGQKCDKTNKNRKPPPSTTSYRWPRAGHTSPPTRTAHFMCNALKRDLGGLYLRSQEKTAGRLSDNMSLTSPGGHQTTGRR